MTQTKWVMYILVISLLIPIACTKVPSLPEYEDISQNVEYTILDFPTASYEDIFWRVDSVVVVMLRELIRPLRQPYALAGDNEFRFLDLPHDTNCIEITDYSTPTQLPDGRLGMIKKCVTDNAFTDASYMVAYDWETGQLEQIVQKPLKHFDIAQCFSWNPAMTKGIQMVGNGLVGTLNWLSPNGPEPVNIILHDEKRKWNLAESYEEDGSIEGGKVSCPSWSPLGDKIAVFVSFDAMGMDGFARLDQPSKLVLIDPYSGDSEIVLSEVHDANPVWSPDGSKIAFYGYVENGLSGQQGDEPYGLWVFDVATHTLKRIAVEKYFQDIAWAPDSNQIAGVWCDQLDCKESEKTEVRSYPIP